MWLDGAMRVLPTDTLSHVLESTVKGVMNFLLSM